MSSSTWKWIVAVGTLIVVFAVGMQLKFGDAMVYFYTPQEVLQKAASLEGQKVRIGGLVVPGSVSLSEQNRILKFSITDNQNHQLLIEHHGVKPDMFRENQGVIAEGVFTAEGGGVLRSEKLLVKHSEQYRSKDHEGKDVDKELLQDSLLDR
jgi:cytochrome c-type biogenesis protein CcmE